MTEPAPPRGFPTSEYQTRLNRAQTLMADVGLAALLLTTEAEVRYFTGYLTRFWESPTRPWYLVVPACGDPVAVIPSIGAALMGQTWITDIRTWSAPDLSDDGVSLLGETLREVCKTGKIGVPSGHESHLRMPLVDFDRLKDGLGAGQVTDDAGIMRRLRLIKSSAEIAKIRQACTIAGRAFARVPRIATAGTPLEQIFRRFQMLCLEEGADWVPYLAGGAGPDGYADVISPATSAPLTNGDVLMLDTGIVWDGYFCDFDRNFSVGHPSTIAAHAHTQLMDAVAAGLDAARPGQRAADIFHAMDRTTTGGAGGSDAGRNGHGLGMQLTEWPSFIAHDHTVIEPGMVLTLEPGVETRDGRIMVHEEDIVITQTGAEFLSPRSGNTLTVI
ncbi:aminopeptidase P family protein [Sulfitobacter sp. TSTF-M16]|uniref:Aminopeptidase P family protein n=1 Tax=Sulfitobacter aestuariivivens TaxID=2766981 RepID=A0A927D2W8_9RHOB|nr:Xaa-Pro peptidase family protein [Sulfitobacter aestuariivivens]MBD3664125.1 aminopeptidase P family protein [Sulfitobacter aestuariivivens]